MTKVILQDFPLTRNFLLFILIALLQGSCNKDDNMTSADATVLVKKNVIDFGNSKSASDIFVSMDVTTEPGVQEGRIIVSTSQVVEDDVLESVPANQYLAFTPVDGKINIYQNLPSDLLDIENNPIGEGAYFVYLAIIRDNQLRKVIGPFSVVLAGQSVFEGSYVGTWNDNLYTDFPISSTVTSDAEGIFYYSGNFQSCCLGSNDGSISFQIDDKAVTSFTYNQDLASFMGGNCTGVYTGSGTINLETGIKFEINFTGTDCEGPHTNGKIVMQRN